MHATKKHTQTLASKTAGKRGTRGHLRQRSDRPQSEYYFFFFLHEKSACNSKYLQLQMFAYYELGSNYTK